MARFLDLPVELIQCMSGYLSDPDDTDSLATASARFYAVLESHRKLKAQFQRIIFPVENKNPKKLHDLLIEILEDPQKAIYVKELRIGDWHCFDPHNEQRYSKYVRKLFTRALSDMRATQEEPNSDNWKLGKTRDDDLITAMLLTHLPNLQILSLPWPWYMNQTCDVLAHLKKGEQCPLNKLKYVDVDDMGPISLQVMASLPSVETIRIKKLTMDFDRWSSVNQCNLKDLILEKSSFNYKGIHDLMVASNGFRSLTYDWQKPLLGWHYPQHTQWPEVGNALRATSTETLEILSLCGISARGRVFGSFRIFKNLRILQIEFILLLYGLRGQPLKEVGCRLPASLEHWHVFHCGFENVQRYCAFLESVVEIKAEKLPKLQSLLLSGVTNVAECEWPFLTKSCKGCKRSGLEKCTVTKEDLSHRIFELARFNG